MPNECAPNPTPRLIGPPFLLNAAASFLAISQCGLIRSHISGNSHWPTTIPVAHVSPGFNELILRNWRGSMPTFSASISIIDSIAKFDWGGPAPRAAAPEALLL